MTTVFLSGSRSISRLNDAIRQRVWPMIEKGFRIVVGDANGADKSMQMFLAEKKYENVVVFCSGQNCRNNIGNWPTKKIEVNLKLKGRDFFAQKDKAMASEADYGLVLWDGKSMGTVNNMLELLKHNKPVAAYFMPGKEFYSLKRVGDLQKLFKHCDGRNYRNMMQLISFQEQAAESDSSLRQRSFHW